MFELASGKLIRPVAFRLHRGEDLLLGIQKVCEEKNIKNGCILTGIGSLNGARFFDPVELPHKKAGYGYSDPIILEGPIELVSASGLICHNNDDILLHVHCAFSDKNGTAYGGHLIEGNKVLLTVDMVIAEFEGINMGREMDPDLEVPIFHPTEI